MGAALHDDDSGGETEQFQVTVTFAEHDAATSLTMRMVFASAAERDRVVTEYGAIEGGNQTLDRLAAYLATQQQGRTV